MIPNFAALAHQGRMLMVAKREADEDAALTAAQVVTPAHAARQSLDHDLQVRLAAAMRTTPSRAGRQSQSEIDAGWTDVIAGLNLGASHARPASQEDDNFGWGSIVEKVQAEVNQTNFATTTSQSETDASWADIIAKAKAGRGLR
jgi:hypothetical protein